MTLPRLVLLTLVVTALCAAGGLVAQVVSRPAGPRVATAVPAPVRERAAADAVALAVLRDWDGRRARAWAHGDAAALRVLYRPGSAAGRRDLAMLRAWSARGLRVRGLGVQVLAARVRLHRPRRVVVRVTDRVAGAVAVGPGVDRPLPRDAPSTRTVVLVRDAGRWQVASVRPVGHPAGQPAR